MGIKTSVKKKLNKFLSTKDKSNTSLFTVDDFLVRYLESNNDEVSTFLQIGANDGRLADPIFNIVQKYNLKGTCVEPIKEYFEKLKENYKALPDVQLVNKAIYHHDGQITMFKVKKESEEKLPDWVKGIASLDKNHHKRSEIQEEHMEEVLVDCIKFDTLLNDYNVVNVDMLVVDTEGFDAQILKMIDFNKIQPKLIYFEHFIEANVITKEELMECLNLLLNNNYYFFFEKNNCLAYKMN